MMDIIILKGKVHVSGRAINEFQQVCGEVYQQYTDKDSFKVMIGSCTDNRYFELISFTNYPFKLVIGMPFSKEDQADLVL